MAGVMATMMALAVTALTAACSPMEMQQGSNAGEGDLELIGKASHPSITGLPPLRQEKTTIAAFDSSPFPYDGMIPDKDVPFLDISDGSRRGHTSGRGGVYWEDQTYSDRSVLLSIPAGFDVRRPAVMVVFFHGNGATLTRDVVDRQGVARQLAESGLNGVLVAPQFAVDALDSSAGRFWQPGAFAQFVAEAGRQLGALYGDPRARHALAHLPVVLVAYSGGYLPAAYALSVGGAQDRVRGVVLLDALYGEQDKFAAWIADKPSSAFFVSAYSDSSRAGNEAMESELSQSGTLFNTGSRPDFSHGVSFVDAGPNVPHVDFVTHAWTDDPLAAILSRVKGYARRGDQRS